MTSDERDRESIMSDISRDERQKPTLGVYNEEANGGRWWKKKSC